MKPLSCLLLFALCAVLAAPARAEMKNDVEFAKVDGESLTLDAFVPEGPGPFPTAILVHGGGFINGTKQSYIKPLFQPLSDAGFTWFTINYRLAPKYRHPAAVEDVERAIRWVKEHAKEYKVDPRRIALIGESAGGHLVSMVGVRGRGATRVAAVVPFYAPHDLEFQARSRNALGQSLSALLGLTELNDAAWKALRDASPSTYVKPGLPPFLQLHGTADEQVPYDQSVRFGEKMKAAGNVCELFTIPDGRHGMGSWDAAHPEYKTFLIDWLRKTLRKTE
jgi:alpha-L-fucosidase 2